MPVEIKGEITQETIEAVIHHWIDLLSEENYTEDCELSIQNPDPNYRWTPTLLEQVINGYGLPYEDTSLPKCKVTKRSTALSDSGKSYKEINFFDVPRRYSDPKYLVIGDIYYDLPIDGKWSDLTAIFKILQYNKEMVTLLLEEIHMM